MKLQGYLAALVLLTACGAKSVGVCSHTADCASGEFCSSGKCAAAGACASSNDCQSGETCTSGHCLAAGASGLLKINRVDGDSTLLDTDTADGSPTLHRIATSFIIAGTGFANGIKSVQFVTAVQSYDLSFIASADAATLTAAIPSALATAVSSDGKTPLAGQIIVTSTNSAIGSDTATVSILRGEPGHDGVGGQGSGTTCSGVGVAVINDNFVCSADNHEQFLVQGSATAPDPSAIATMVVTADNAVSGIFTNNSANQITLEVANSATNGIAIAVTGTVVANQSGGKPAMEAVNSGLGHALQLINGTATGDATDSTLEVSNAGAGGAVNAVAHGASDGVPTIRTENDGTGSALIAVNSYTGPAAQTFALQAIASSFTKPAFSTHGTSSLNGDVTVAGDVKATSFSGALFIQTGSNEGSIAGPDDHTRVAFCTANGKIVSATNPATGRPIGGGCGSGTSQGSYLVNNLGAYYANTGSVAKDKLEGGGYQCYFSTGPAPAGAYAQVTCLTGTN